MFIVVGCMWRTSCQSILGNQRPNETCAPADPIVCCWRGTRRQRKVASSSSLTCLLCSARFQVYRIIRILFRDSFHEKTLAHTPGLLYLIESRKRNSLIAVPTTGELSAPNLETCRKWRCSKKSQTCGKSRREGE